MKPPPITPRRGVPQGEALWHAYMAGNPEAVDYFERVAIEYRRLEEPDVSELAVGVSHDQRRQGSQYWRGVFER